MERAITGIHHVTALARDPQANADFYTRALGLRLVKRTVNFDDPGTYHLYYGDELGRPGTILTFFPWPLARRGTHGAGQATVTSFAIPEGSLGYWTERLDRLGIERSEPRPRFEEEVVTLYDPDGLRLELVAHAAGEGGAAPLPWTEAGVPAEHAVRGFHGVALTEWNADATFDTLSGVMGWQKIAEEPGRVRFRAEGGGSAALVDVLPKPDAPRGRVAAGTVHHVAFRVGSDEAQAFWHRDLTERGFQVSPILDRQYFHSIYFREPGGVLFEIATDLPGFTADEPAAELGNALKLPPWLEASRQEIEEVLPPLSASGAAGGAV